MIFGRKRTAEPDLNTDSGVRAQEFLPVPPPAPVYCRGTEEWPESGKDPEFTDPPPAPSFRIPPLSLRTGTPSWFISGTPSWSIFRPFRRRPLDASVLRARLAQQNAHRDKEHGHG